MKKSIWTLVLLITLNGFVMAQKGFNLEKEITINVPASQLWEMVGPGFVNVGDWSSNVDHAVGSGTPEFEGAVCSERVCDVNVKGFTKIDERLTKYNDSTMNLAYEVMDGMPSFMVSAVNDWTVVPLGPNSSKLVMKAEFISKGLMGMMTRGMMQRKMSETLETVLNDAKIYSETGKVSKAKKERIEELRIKQLKAAA